MTTRSDLYPSRFGLAINGSFWFYIISIDSFYIVALGSFYIISLPP